MIKPHQVEKRPKFRNIAKSKWHLHVNVLYFMLTICLSSRPTLSTHVNTKYFPSQGCTEEANHKYCKFEE